MSVEKKTGLYFVGEAIADLKADEKNPRILNASLGGGSYFGCIGAANAIRNVDRDADMSSFFLGAVSNDHFGSLIVQDFEEAGVDCCYARRTENISMLALVSKTDDGRNKFEFYGRNKPNTVESITRSDMPEILKEDGQLFCFGSVVMTLSPAREVLTAYLEEQAGLGHVIYFDPNTRPSIIPDHAAYVERLLDIAKSATVFRASEEDIEFIYPDLSHKEAAQKFLGCGIKAMLITKGGKGVHLYLPDWDFYVETDVNPEIVNTVGAGDNFNAGILLALGRRGAVSRDAVTEISRDEWVEIAGEANQVAYQHLLKVNGLV